MDYMNKLRRLRPCSGSRRTSNRHRIPGFTMERLESRRLLTTQVSTYPIETTGASSQFVTLGPDNNIWVTLSSNNIGQLNTTTSVIKQYPIPTPNSSPTAIITGPDRNLWFIESGTNQFGVVTPSTGAITEIPVLPDGATPIQDLATGTDGNIWFTEYNANKIGLINPTTHAVEEFSIPTANSKPYDLVQGPSGNMWFTEAGKTRSE
jgi:virginiamycin B lyase